MTASLRSLPVIWWLATPAVLYILAANLFWRLQSWTDGRGQRVGEAARRIAAGPAPALGGFLFNIGIPYAALLLGVLDTRLTGLIGLDWLPALRIAAVMAIATGVMFWLDHSFVRAFPALPNANLAQPSALAGLWRAVFQQAHLGFYRAILATLLSPYAGAFAALGLVLCEWTLNPAWRAGWSKQPQQETLAHDLALALTTTILFIYTNNFWVCLALHLVLVAGLHLRRHEAAPANSAESL